MFVVFSWGSGVGKGVGVYVREPLTTDQSDRWSVVLEWLLSLRNSPCFCLLILTVFVVLCGVSSLSITSVTLVSW